MAIRKLPTPIVKPRGGQINGSVDQPVTERQLYGDPGGSECFVPGWDRYSGNEQGMSRTVERLKLGQKKTPIGRGVSIRRKWS